MNFLDFPEFNSSDSLPSTQSLLSFPELQKAYHEKQFIDYMLNHINTLIFVADEDSHFVFVNDTVVDKYGFTRDELLKMSVSDIDINVTQSDYSTFWKELVQKKTMQLHSIHKDKFWNLYPVLIQTHYIEYGGKAYVFGAVEDESYIQNLLNAHNGFIILTDGKKLVMGNTGMISFFGYPDFLTFISEHKCICEFFIEEEGFIYHQPTWIEEVKQAQEHDAKVKIKNPLTNQEHIFLVCASAFDESRFLVTFTDITELETYKNELERLAITDGLTLLYNRRYFNDIMPREINRAKRNKQQLAFIMLDVDYFKRYNDHYGHANGDNVLIRIASTIEYCFSRASDFCFRLGGEEFGIICTGNTPQDVYSQTEQLRQNIEELAIEHKGNSASSYATVSIGIAFCDGNTTMEILYSTADAELYRAKEAGRNGICPVQPLL
ncbi:sensor domain-containing diguanylate cyclase [Sulfuricurvum sp. RIFCSPLOWO2_12_FULL_43_24]|uniref:sensor domain-containing diguanylate cyclase n=1 Tax=Sulfuricurvum sp. RIFCSPLOWO2_12_FULL_43_24 TaxID=1802247 RepID=UPI0008BBE663|nr:sensor domain-containing diguanylate cyclase [Sulfuricurvum sp. RIFCSPLOWO2_12_FULL_43_24]OHD89081.1 MAG: hypothetical protein A3G19_03630 [Sulfuricurvum sp. RIFCSPLOWO2_12_FULL_43_24]